jgi:predicted DNA-binding transcriptional regulator AlpA
MSMTGLSRTAIYTLVGSNDFPAAIKLGVKSIGWYLTDVERWLASRPVANIGAAGKEAQAAALKA